MIQFIEGDHFELVATGLDFGDHGDAAILHLGVLLKVGQQGSEDCLQRGTMADDDEIAFGRAAVFNELADRVGRPTEDVGPGLELDLRPLGLVVEIDPRTDGHVSGEEAGHLRSGLLAEELAEARLHTDLRASSACDGLRTENGALHGRRGQAVQPGVAETVGTVLRLPFPGFGERSVMWMRAGGCPFRIGVVVTLCMSDEEDGDGVLGGKEALTKGVADETRGLSHRSAAVGRRRGEQRRGNLFVLGKGGQVVEVLVEVTVVEASVLKVDEREGGLAGALLFVDEEERAAWKGEAKRAQTGKHLGGLTELGDQLALFGLRGRAVGQEAVEGRVEVVDGLVAAAKFIEPVLERDLAGLDAVDIAAEQVGCTSALVVEHVLGQLHLQI